MFAHMHDGVYRELAAQPEVKRQVVVRGHQIGVVVGRDQIQIAPTGGLVAHKHVAITMAGHHEAAAAHHGVLLGRTPQRIDGVAAGWVQAVEVHQVVGHGQALAGGPHVVGV